MPHTASGQPDPRTRPATPARTHTGPPLGTAWIFGGVSVLAGWAVAHATLAPGAERAGVALGCSAAVLVCGLGSLAEARALQRGASAGATATLAAMAIGFLAKMLVLAIGTIALHLRARDTFHPFAFAIAFAGASVLFHVTSTFLLVRRQSSAERT